MRSAFKFLFWIVATLTILWSGYWLTAAFVIKSKILLALNQSTPTASLSLGQIEVSGFPSKFDVELRDFSIQHNDEISWSTSGARLTAASIDPTMLDIDMSRPHAIRGRWGEMILDTERAQIIALFGKTAALPLQDLRVAFDQLSLEHAEGMELTAEKLIAVVKNRTGEDPGVFLVETEITGTDISKIVPDLPAGYQRLGPLTAVFDTFFTAGLTLGDTSMPLPDFRGLVLHKMSTGFGESNITLEGKLQWAPNGTVSGEVNLEVTNWRSLLKLAKDMGKTDAEGEQVFSEMLADVEAISGKPGTLQLPLTIRNGAITYGMLTLGLIPPIR